MKFRLNESLNLPYEGFFWVIDDDIIGFTKEVPMYNYEIEKSETHQQTWNKLKPDNCTKSYDYYPRGRVMVDPEYNQDGTFKGYAAMIFIDQCIDNEKDKEKIINYYNLNVPKMQHIMWMGNLHNRAGINHYTCHNCRNI